MRRHFVSAFAVFLALVTSGLSMAQGNPFVGTWKLNMTKSQFEPGPPPKSQTRTWESSGKVTVKGIDAMGMPRIYGYTIKLDDKEYPTFGATNGADSIASKPVDARTVQATFKMGGKPFEIAKYSVSKNGKVLTIFSQGTRGGHSFNNVQVWDKQ